MVNIHKTFSLSELVILCDIFKFNIPDYDDYYKKDLIVLMSDYIKCHKKLKLQNEYFNFKNITQLKRYLEKPNTRYKLNIEQQKYINVIAKEVINFFYNDYNINKLRYYYLHCKQIAKFGDFKNIRKAINIMNTFYSAKLIEKKIELEYSIFFLYKLKNKKHLNKNFNNNFKCNNKNTLINFN